MQNKILNTIINQNFFTKTFLKNLGMTDYNSIFNWTEAVIETCNKDIAGVQVRVYTRSKFETAPPLIKDIAWFQLQFRRD